LQEHAHLETILVIKKVSMITGMVIFCTALIFSAWYILTPHSLEDCYLKNIKPGLSETASQSIIDACDIKFYTTEAKCTERELTTLEKSQITGSAYISGEYLRFKIHNGNSDIPIKTILMSLDGDNMKPPQIFKGTIETFSQIDPLSTSEVFAKIPFTPKNFKIGIESLKTCEYKK
jgi:hypothetical protein